ncbi:MAG: hypothetical protein Fues2KO_42650 [Fuerstiella sp.]
MPHLRSRRRRSAHSVPVEILEQRLPLAADFSVALLPDTQIYAEQFPEIFETQTQWLADNAALQNIAFVSHIGDVVDHPDSLLEWQRADQAMDTLDGVVPYSVLPGNHDFDPQNSHGNADNFTTFFGADRYSQYGWYGGASSDELNHYQYFSGGGFDFLHLTLEWEPRPSSVAWARQILNNHPTTPTILSTHAYLDDADGRSTTATTSDGLSGDQIYQQIVRDAPQIFLVMNGHFPGEAHQTSFNDAGLPVFELMADYQNRPNGGDGWLQLLNFRPDLDRIDVSTYSPALDQFETDSDSQFSFFFDFDARFDLAGPPDAKLSQPLDNGPLDLEPADGTVRVDETQAAFRIQLTDLTPGVQDASVVSHTIQLTRNGSVLTDGLQYAFTYDAANDQIELTSLNGGFTTGSYRIVLNSQAEQIVDQSGNAMPPTTLTVVIDEAPAAPPDSLYFSINSTETLPGNLTVSAADIVYWNGSEFSVHFDGSDVGLSSATIDALVVLNSQELLLSFTHSLYVPGIADRVDDSDILRFTAAQFGEDTSGSFSVYFDGSDVGLTTSDEDINALALLPGGDLLISTRGPTSVPGLSSIDEDLIRFTPTQLGDFTDGSWSMYLDGSDLPEFSPEDIYGATAYPDGDLYLTLSSSFSAADLSSRDEDVFSLTLTQTGEQSAGSFNGPVFFDGSQFGLSSTDVYSIHVPVRGLDGSGNVRPVAQDDQIAANEDDSVTFNVLSDHGNGMDSDVDGSLNAGSTQVHQTPIHGSLVNHGNGSFTYTPDSDFFGTDSFTYTVGDDDGAVSDQATVTIVVAAVNDAPTAFDDRINAVSGSSQSIRVLDDNGFGADFDVDSALDPASVTVVSGPTYGSLISQVDGTFTYQPPEEFEGTDTFLYTVRDLDGAISNTATVSIEVTSEEQPFFYFAVDRSHTFANGLAAANEDILAWDGISTVKVFDGSDVGMGSEKLNSFSWINPTSVLLTFSSDATVPGVGAVTPRDIVRFDATQLGETTTGIFSLYFVGSHVGLDLSGEAIDGLKYLADGSMVLSTRSSFAVPGFSGRDEDLLRFVPTGFGSETAGTWDFYFDGGDVEWSGHDVDAFSIDDRGTFYLSPNADMAMSIGNIADEDVVVFLPDTLGASTSGSYESTLYLDGSSLGLASADVIGIDVTSFGPQLLLAAVATEAGFLPPEREMTEDWALDLLPQARSLLETEGIVVPDVQIYVDDLPGDVLGMNFGRMITLDRDAAGIGWQQPGPVSFGYDPVVVLAHELGHAAGLHHHSDLDLMQPVLSPVLNLPIPRGRGASLFDLQELDEFWQSGLFLRS